jgi:hypothetical protein
MEQSGTTQPEKKAGVIERLQQCRSAYASVPKHLQSPVIIASVRAAFPSVRIRTFEKFVKSREEWGKNLAHYIGQVDGLIIVCDSSRVVTPGCVREIQTAKQLDKLLIIFSLEPGEAGGRWERFSGIETAEVSGIKTRTLRRYTPKPKVSPQDQEAA